nr:hypothetical protein [Planctomycetota bacterium]
ALFHVHRDRAGVALTVKVTWGGWAEATDYAALPSEVVIPSGAKEIAIPLVPVDDQITEGREEVLLRIEDGAGYTVTAAGREVRTRIVDNDWAGIPKRPRKIYGHFMGCFCAGASAIQWHATSGLGTMDCPEDVQVRERIQAPGGEWSMQSPLGAWARNSVGGTYRNFALAPYVQNPALTIEQAAEIEIRRAIRIGMDGFTFDAWAGGKGAMELFSLMIRICEEKDLPFELTITPDATCIDASMEELKPYPGDGMRKVLGWVIDKHGKSPKLARRDGKILVFGYGAQWPWVGYLYEVVSKKFGEGRKKEEYDAEVMRLRTCEEGWALMGEAYRKIEADLGQPIYWEMDLAPSFLGHGVSNWGKHDNAAAAALAAAPIIAKDFPVVGQFLWEGDVPAIARSVIAAKKERSHPLFMQYENFGNFQLASPGLDWTRGNWELAREIPSTLIQQITWNDYHEATALSPGYNTRYAYTDLTGQYIDWWKTGKEPSSDHDRVYIFSHKYTHDSKIFPFRTVSRADNMIEVLTILPKPAKLRMPGRKSTDGLSEWDAPAGLSFKQFPLTAGPVSVELLRAGKVALTLVSPEPVSDRPFRQDTGKVGVCTEDERLWREDFGAKTPYFVYSEYGDVDADGLPNWFEMLWFGKFGDMSTAAVAEPDEDADGDGASNLEEFRAQTDPIDSASH